MSVPGLAAGSAWLPTSSAPSRSSITLRRRSPDQRRGHDAVSRTDTAEREAPHRQQVVVAVALIEPSQRARRVLRDGCRLRPDGDLVGRQ